MSSKINMHTCVKYFDVLYFVCLVFSKKRRGRKKENGKMKKRTDNQYENLPKSAEASEKSNH